MNKPRPAARPMPGPVIPPGSGTRDRLSSAGGGPSTVIDTRFSPRNNTRPRGLFSSLSTAATGRPGFGFTFLNSSQSPSIKFMCLSNALYVPTNVRPSCRVQRILKLMCWSILELRPNAILSACGELYRAIIGECSNAGCMQNPSAKRKQSVCDAIERTRIIYIDSARTSLTKYGGSNVSQ